MRLPKLASPGDGAKATPISDSPQAKTVDLRWLWLLIGFALLPFTAYRVVIPLAAWIAPVFLLRFERVSRRGGPALWLIFAAYMLAGVIDLIGIPGRGLDLLLGLTLFPLLRAVRFTLPYVTDRLLGARLGTWPRMLLFPASFVASDWLMGLIHLTGTVGSPAYSQYGVLPLIQLVSVTGMYGLTFLVIWFASAVNAVWEHGFQWRATRLPLAVFGSVLAAVFAFGFARLSLAAPTSPTVKAATITLSPAVFNQANNGLDWTTFNRATSAQREAWRPRFSATVDQMLARTQTALSQGAKLVVWQEESALVLPGDRQNAISRAAALARSHGAYLEIWLGVLNQSQSLPYFANQAILISPAGSVVWTYNKTYPVVVNGDSSVTLRGSGVLPVADTPYGRLTTAICNDVGYPGLLRQAGQKGADILLVPTDEPSSFWASCRCRRGHLPRHRKRHLADPADRRRHLADDRLPGPGDRQPELLGQQRRHHAGQRPDHWRIDHLQPHRRCLRLPVHNRPAARNPPGPARKAQRKAHLPSHRGEGAAGRLGDPDRFALRP